MFVTVSIIIPTYNRLSLLQQSVNSVVAQTWKDWELIIVDDGSTDKTVTYFNSLNDPRIRVIQLSHCGNVAQVRNAGAKTSHGKYLAFLDSDDLWEPDKLAIQLSAIQEVNARWSCTSYDHIDSAGHTIPVKPGSFTVLHGTITSQLLSAEVGVSVSSLLVEKTLFNEAGAFDEDPLLNLREDYDLILRISLLAPVLVVPHVLLHVMEHTGRTTHACTDSYERMARVYEKFSRLTNDVTLKQISRKRRAKHLAEAAAIDISRGNAKRALRNFMSAIRSGVSIRVILSALKKSLVGVKGRK